MGSEFHYRFTEHAEQDLDAILQYLSESADTPRAAQVLGKHIFDRIDDLRRFPALGTPVDNEFIKVGDIRKLSVDQYVIYYTVDTDEHILFILRILYGKRNLEEILKTM